MFKKPRGMKAIPRIVIGLLLAGMTMPGGLSNNLALGGILPPLPGAPPLPPLPPLPLPPPDLTLAPPELPRIPSLPQILPSNAPPPSGSTELPVTGATMDARILILSADGNEPVLGTIRQAADYEGIPYTLYVASRSPGGFTPDMLSHG